MTENQPTQDTKDDSPVQKIKDEPNEEEPAVEKPKVECEQKESLTHKQAMSTFADGLMDIICVSEEHYF